MRLKTYMINESSLKKMRTEEWISAVKKNCSRTLKDIKVGKNVMFRREAAISPLLIPFGKRTARKDRRVMDTPGAVSKAADDAFEEIFGWKPRTQGLFCWVVTKKSGETLSDANYLVIPTNDYEAVYSRNMEDFYLDFKSEIEAIYGIDTKEKSANYLAKYITPEALKSMGYKNKNVFRASMGTAGQFEASVRASRFYLVNAMIPNPAARFMKDMQLLATKEQQQRIYNMIYE